MKIVAGLGNPGGEYADTFHNVGFKALDRFAERINAPRFIVKGDAELCDVTNSAGEKIFLCKPQTYMNLSGDAIGGLSRYYKVPPENILVIYDDVDIKRGTVRARLNGSAGTHNGMRDIVAKLGTEKFARVRIGTGFKPDYISLVDYVLMRIPTVDKPILDRAYDAACDMIEAWIEDKPWQELTVNV
ncbi:MAG: aminoacyl-tRNA hydrolase [Clostridiales bacterium]|nr:aminoacyl-tRNA hydrolase [Clostridiales bacterium]